MNWEWDDFDEHDEDPPSTYYSERHDKIVYRNFFDFHWVSAHEFGRFTYVPQLRRQAQRHRRLRMVPGESGRHHGPPNPVSRPERAAEPEFHTAVGMGCRRHPQDMDSERGVTMGREGEAEMDLSALCGRRFGRFPTIVARSSCVQSKPHRS